MNDNIYGAFLTILSALFFILNDTFVKLLGNDISYFQILFVRGIFATIFLAWLCMHYGALVWRIHLSDKLLICGRAICEVSATYCILMALFNMPLANLTAIMQLTPLTIPVACAVFFREPIGARGWGAICFGLLGMLFIVKPGTDGFNIYSIYVLIAVVFVTARDLCTRKIDPKISSLFVTFVSASFVFLFGGIMGLGQNWVWMSGMHWLYIFCATFFISGGYFLSVIIMRVGVASFVVPFRYTGLVWALLLGLFIFGDFPEATTILGAVIIVASGLFSMWQESRMKAQALAV